MYFSVFNCPVLHNDSVLSVECPDGFQNGGECFFTCRDGFKLIGHNKTSCKVAQDFDYAEWDFNDKHPYCEGIYQVHFLLMILLQK